MVKYGEMALAGLAIICYKKEECGEILNRAISAYRLRQRPSRDAKSVLRLQGARAVETCAFSALKGTALNRDGKPGSRARFKLGKLSKAAGPSPGRMAS